MLDNKTHENLFSLLYIEKVKVGNLGNHIYFLFPFFLGIVSSEGGWLYRSTIIKY